VIKTIRWGDMACSGTTGDSVLAVGANKESQILYIWHDSFDPKSVFSRHEDPAKGTIKNTTARRCAWHPWRPLVVTVFGGKIALWKSGGVFEEGIGVSDSAWLAFAPGFELIESENVVYAERPDEFAADKIELEKRLRLNDANADSQVDVLGRAANDAWLDEDSDSDESSARIAPRLVTRGIGYFVRATVATIHVHLS